MPKKSKQDYLDDPKFRQFVSWHVLPKEMVRRRTDGGEYPATMQGFADQYDLGVRTLYRWKKTEAYAELRNRLVETWIEGSIPEIIEEAKSVATEEGPAGHNDRKLLLEIAGITPDATINHQGRVEHDHTHSVEDTRTMDEGTLRRQFRSELRNKPQFEDKSDEELDAIIDALINAHGGDSQERLPTNDEPAEKTPKEYVISDPDPEE